MGLVDAASLLPAPVCDEKWLAITKKAWLSFWESPVASVVDRSSDLPAVTRLFSLVDERERCYRSARRGRVVAGSTGQPALNPLYKQMSTLDAEIRQLEDRFGLTPMARLKLGVQFGEARRTLAELNALAESEGDDDDPRFRVIEVESDDAG